MTYGNFQTGDFNAALDRLDNTKPINEKDPFIAEGEHILMLVELAPFNHQTHGPSARASFEVMQTNNPAVMVGSRTTKMWNLTRASKYPNQPTDSDKFADFVRNLVGAQPGTSVGAQCRALIRDRVSDQLGRGMLIHARGVNVSKKADKPYVDVYWKPHAQTQDEIKARRVQIEAKLGAAPAQPQPQVPPGAQPGYGPTPSQQIQGAPNLMYYPNQPMPQQQFGQPMPQMQPPAPQQQFAPQQPMQGPGLTQQIPGGNNNPQGGQQGGGGMLGW